jgi:hypothetical protein
VEVEEEDEDAEAGWDGEVEWLDYEVDSEGVDDAEEEGEEQEAGGQSQKPHQRGRGRGGRRGGRGGGRGAGGQRQRRQLERRRRQEVELTHQEQVRRLFAELQGLGFQDALGAAGEPVVVTHDRLCVNDFLDREVKLTPSVCDDHLLAFASQTDLWGKRAKEVEADAAVGLFDQLLDAAEPARGRGLTLSGSGSAKIRRSLPCGGLIITLLNFVVAPRQQLAVIRAMRHLRWPPLGKAYRSQSGEVAGPVQDLIHALLWRPGVGEARWPPRGHRRSQRTGGRGRCRA